MPPHRSRYGSEVMDIPGLTYDVSHADPKARIERYIDAYRAQDAPDSFERAMMREIRLLEATSPPNVKAVFELEMTQTYCSKMGNAHGGAVSLIFDMCTSMCLAPFARQDFWLFGGVSRTLSVTYMRPVRQGVTVVIECEVLQVGQRLATIRSLMKGKDDGKVLCACEHNKASISFQEAKI